MGHLERRHVASESRAPLSTTFVVPSEVEAHLDERHAMYLASRAAPFEVIDNPADERAGNGERRFDTARPFTAQPHAIRKKSAVAATVQTCHLEVDEPAIRPSRRHL